MERKMGRSTASCFKIITCGSDSVDRDDLDSSESKGSDKRGWSFRKRSARHRVLSNTVITEVPSSEHKDVTELPAVDIQETVNSVFSEKATEILWTDEIPRSSLNAATASNLATGDSSTDKDNFDANLDESAIILIQAGIRARRAVLKHKNIIKLQAAIRGHLVRRHAVGTLRCVQAIVKMQALVRARHANLHAKKSTVEENIDVTDRKDYRHLKLPELQNTETHPGPKYISIERLLSNSFARQLLESTPRTTQINIKCDPSRNDSAWKWLERWMSLSSVGIESPHTPCSSKMLQEEDDSEHPESQVDVVVPSQDSCETTNVKSCVGEAALPSEGKEDLRAINLVTHNTEQPQLIDKSLWDSEEKSEFLLNQNMHSDSVVHIDINPFPGKPELQIEHPKRSVKRIASEPVDSEGRKSVFGSKKVSNPAFIAAHSKFEELISVSNSMKTSSPLNQDITVDSCADTLASAHSKFEELISVSNSMKSSSPLNQDITVDSCADTLASAPDNAIGTKSMDLSEILVSQSSMVHVDGSECGTELSITSTLDSPDQSEVRNVEFEKETKVLEVAGGDIKNSYSLDVEEYTGLGTELTYSISFVPEKHDIGNTFDSELVKDLANEGLQLQVEEKLEENVSNVQAKLGHETGPQPYKSSPEASPRSHITGPELQGTPSQKSDSTKQTKIEKKLSSQKRKSWSGSKKSPISSSLDSGIRSSLEQLPKEPKAGQRRNSFGSPRPDQIDQEPRGSSSSSSNSLPSYMQPTESARAKALANSSPRSSPGVLDKEAYIKKRHSLPGANGRQGSPRIQRSMSQAQQGSTKGNSSNERKWQR